VSNPGTDGPYLVQLSQIRAWMGFWALPLQESYRGLISVAETLSIQAIGQPRKVVFVVTDVSDCMGQ